MSQRGRERDIGKERFWRDVLLRWQRSGQSIHTFCDHHGLSEGSFHAWRRTIAQRDQQAAGVPAVHGAGDLPAFVPLRVTGTPAASSSISPLELVLGQGRVIRVPPGFDANTLRNLLAVLEEAPSC